MATRDEVRAELVRSRAFIRGAETQLTKALDALDSLDAEPVEPTPEPELPVEPDPEPEPEPSEPGTFNEPAGLVRAFHADGTHKNFSGLESPNIVVVDDPKAPHGRAIEWRYAAGMGGGAAGHHDPRFGPFREVYYRLVMAHNPAWDNHSGGDKLMYFGHVGKASSYFIQMRGGVDWGTGDYRAGFQNQAPNLGSPSFFWISRDARGEEGFVLTDGDYHTWEIHMVAQSRAGAADGRIRIWYDGALKEDRADMQWVTSGDVRFANCQWYPYWGGQGDTKRIDDWLRFGELYISGKA